MEKGIRSKHGRKEGEKRGRSTYKVKGDKKG